MHIHFLGIAGIGVSALAQVAQAQGAMVSGSDPNADPDTNPAIRRLQEGGARLYTTHEAANISDTVELVVATAAVSKINPEIQAARERGIRVVSRADYLGELMAQHEGVTIAVAGTHGKTTTTALIGVMLQEAGLDPTVFVGGEVAQLGGNVRIGSKTGPFVAEACEAYDSFLSLSPNIAVITNIEADHLDHFGDEQGVLTAFRRFVNNLSPGGSLIACMDDPGVRRLVTEVQDGQEKMLYGIEYGLDALLGVTFENNIRLEPAASFDLQFHNDRVRIVLTVPGRHNILNALAAVYVGTSFNLSGETIARGLAAFHGTERRQEILGEVSMGKNGSVLVMDDYAHHPTEIHATLDALRSAYPSRRLIAIFQPHLYSRTRDFLPQFAGSLAAADALIVTDVYAAREKPIEGVNAADIVTLAKTHRHDLWAEYVLDKADIPFRLRAQIRPNDLVVFLGAGDIREPGEAFVRLLQSEAAQQ